jgi:hypothetical protein
VLVSKQESENFLKVTTVVCSLFSNSGRLSGPWVAEAHC